MKHTNSRGFAVLEAILVLLIIGIVGAVGWYVYDQRQADKSAQSSITNFDECVAAGNPIMESYPEQCSANGQTYVNDVQQKSEESSESNDASDEFLIIEEWNVKIKSSESQMNYKLVKFDDGEVAYITNEKAQNLQSIANDDNCNDSDENGVNHWYLAAISRTKSLPENSSEADQLKIDGYYYYAQGGNGTCSLGSAREAESAARAELLKAAETIQLR